MLTREEFKIVSENAVANLRETFPLMIKYKQIIQRAIIPMLTDKEIDDIRNSRLNEDVVTKLTKIASKFYQEEPCNQTLHCLSMAIGTIIKEYEWGTHYISNDGMFQLVIRISEQN